MSSLLSPGTRLLAAVVVSSLGAALLATGCGRVDVGALPVSEHFADCGEFSGNDEVATVDCPDGELRIRVSHPEVSPIHVVPFRFRQSVATLTVDADVRGSNGSVYGLGCATTGPGEPGRGYAFVIVPNVSTSIVRLDISGDGTKQALETLGSTESEIVPETSHRVGAVCRNVTGGSAKLAMLVDGKVVVKARDDAPLGPFRAALAVVISAPPDSGAAFDNLTASERRPPKGRN